MKSIFVLTLVICVFLTLLIAGCVKAPAEPASKESPPVPVERVSEPASPVTFEVSFPDGAPPLNREAEISCIVKSHFVLKNVNIELRLPEGFELISGNLSWFGDITVGEKEIIKGAVRAVKIGNWEIEMYRSMDPEWQSAFSIGHGWYDAIYVLISEDSAEWREHSPYRIPSSTPGVAQVERVDETIIPIVDLSISHPPKVNEPAEVTCILSSQIDMPNMNAQIELTYGGDLISGNLEWQGDLKACVPEAFSAQIIYKSTGLRCIGWHVWQTGKETSWANPRAIELRIGNDQSSFLELKPVLPPPPSVTP